MGEPLLFVEDLRTSFHTDSGVVDAVDGIDLTLERGATLGLVGESGCGKSVTSLSILRLINRPGRSTAQRLEFDGQNLLKLGGEAMRQIRGKEIAMIFQEPMTALTPVFTIGYQIIEAIMLHQKVDPQQARQRAIAMLDTVGIPSPERRINDYPHQMSGGMQQRALIAMALSCNPKLLIADEPTTALDVTMQAQILALIRDMQQRMDMAIILITHDLGVVAENTQDISIMYLGRIVEKASTKELFSNPRHPYTKGLLRSIPRIDAEDVEDLYAIRGNVPNPRHKPKGCRFYNRCDVAVKICAEQEPELINHSGHWVRCWLEEGITDD